jgi:hypothetical protein
MEKKSKIIAIAVIVILSIALFFPALYAVGYFPQVSAAASSTVVENVFVDIDSDGDLDLLLEGQVIFNSPLSARSSSDQSPDQ